MVRAWAVVAAILAVALAGCFQSPRSNHDASAAEPPGTHVIERMDGASASFERRQPGSLERTSLVSRPQDVWNHAMDQVPGLVTSVVATATTYDPLTGNTLTESQERRRIALDACGTPLWTWYGDDGADGVAIFFARGERHAPGWHEAVLALQPADLPADGREQVRRHGDFVLHVGPADEGWQVAWTTQEEPLGTGQWAEGWRLRWKATEPFPAGVGNATHQWERTAMDNAGGPLADCFAGRDVPTVVWGPWGPDQDPPLPISWNDLVASVRGDPALTDLQEFLRQHGDAYLWGVVVDPAHENRLFGLALGESPPTWSLFFGAPGATRGPIVLCRVFDGGNERPDVHQCDDKQGEWDTTVPLPDPDWTALQAHDVGPWFTFIERYGRPADWFLFALQGPDPDTGKPLAVKLATASDYYADQHYVHWDPQDPDSFVVLGFAWDEFLHPPG